MGGGASVPAAQDSEAKLQTCMLDIFELLGGQSVPTTRQIASVVSNAAQAIAHAGLAMLFFKVSDLHHLPRLPGWLCAKP